MLLVLFTGIISKDVIISKYDYSKTILKTNKLLYNNELSKYNQILKELDLKNINNYIAARVIYRDINNFYQYITINKGSKHNIRTGDVVLNGSNFIGVVKNVEKYRSLIMLVSNPLLKLSVKLNNSYGTLKNIDGELIIDDLILDSINHVGDSIYTSGLTYIPDNFYVGKIKKIIPEESGIKNKIIIDLESINNINYVMVIKGDL